jgi:hypothetical protein
MTLRRFSLASLVLAATATPSASVDCSVTRQCACASQGLDYTVNQFLRHDPTAPVNTGWATASSSLFVLATVTDTIHPHGAYVPSEHRWRVEAWWSRNSTARDIGQAITLHAGDEPCGPARWQHGKKYLLYLGFVGDRLRPLVCHGYYAGDSSSTRKAIATLDSAVRRR